MNSVNDNALAWRPHRAGRPAAVLLAPVLLALALPAVALAGPTVGELRTVCARAIAAGNQGVDAAMCEWYAVPCDCKLTRPDVGWPRWCMPASVSVDQAMLAVTARLSDAPDPGADAGPVVAEILSRLYPCDD
jgi:hypothetical protein